MSRSSSIRLPPGSKSGSRYSAATYLSNAGIPVWVDTKVAIAHNKVMIIDGGDDHYRQLQFHGGGAEPQRREPAGAR